MEIEEATIPLNEPIAEKVRSWHIVLVLILGLCALTFHAWAREVDGLVHIRMLDIGQGDAVLVIAPNGNQVLIDGGPDGTILSKLGEYLPSWDRELDVVIASHKDSDHITGLVAVLERYDVKNIISGTERRTSAIARAWDDAVANEGATVTEGIAGMTIELGASISLSILYPYESRNGEMTANANNDSIVFMLRHEYVTMLFTGDAESPVERRLIADGVVVDADILKAGHHGSKTSTTAEFLAAVTPQIVLISNGRDNRYGHPHDVILARLESFGIPYYRTDTQGDVTVTSDGRSFSITTKK